MKEGTSTRTLTPLQLKAIALRLQGTSVTKIAVEVGRDRTTVSRWFSNDPLVIEELTRRADDQYQTEIQQHANLRAKAREVVEAALDAGDVKAALAILRLGAVPAARGSNGAGGLATDAGRPRGSRRGDDAVLELARVLEITSPWQIHVRRAVELLRALPPVSDSQGITERLLLLDDVVSTVASALEQANGEGLAGYSTLTERQRQVLAGEARRATEGAWAIIGGDDEDREPQWPGEADADRAIKQIGEALRTLVASIEGAPAALEGGAGADGARLGAQIIAAGKGAALVTMSDERPTISTLAGHVTILTAGFTDLVQALDEGAAITADDEDGWGS